MKKIAILTTIFLSTITSYSVSFPDDEMSLFNSHGEPVAYIADDLTIYLWSGKPVSYLTKHTKYTYHIYGFNGKHLGWLENGLMYNHSGYITCSTKYRMKYTKFESFKGFKQFKPFKSFPDFPPFQPVLYDNWSRNFSCKSLLLLGTK